MAMLNNQRVHGELFGDKEPSNYRYLKNVAFGDMNHLKNGKFTGYQEL